MQEENGLIFRYTSDNAGFYQNKSSNRRREKRREETIAEGRGRGGSVRHGSVCDDNCSAEPVEAAAQTPRMVVDMTDRQGEIMHGASGFLYGISSENVPTTDLITPLKPTVLATKGILGTEHPYGDAADVAETFFASGGEMLQMYTSNYYAIFARDGQHAVRQDLKEIIVPAVVEWKESWKEEHGTPEDPKTNWAGLTLTSLLSTFP